MYMCAYIYHECILLNCIAIVLSVVSIFTVNKFFHLMYVCVFMYAYIHNRCCEHVVEAYAAWSIANFRPSRDPCCHN